MTEEGIRQFAAALAARYLRIKEEYSRTARQFLTTDISNTTEERFQTARTFADRAYTKLELLNDVISDLPSEAMQAFQMEYERYTTK